MSGLLTTVAAAAVVAVVVVVGCLLAVGLCVLPWVGAQDLARSRGRRTAFVGLVSVLAVGVGPALGALLLLRGAPRPVVVLVLLPWAVPAGLVVSGRSRRPPGRHNRAVGPVVRERPEMSGPGGIVEG